MTRGRSGGRRGRLVIFLLYISRTAPMVMMHGLACYDERRMWMEEEEEGMMVHLPG
jgi:hypothetical protein